MRLYAVIFFTLLASSVVHASDMNLKLYRPFGAGNQEVPLRIAAYAKGACMQQSMRIKREDAWRCKAEGKTYDPCFIHPYGNHKEALCPKSPWDDFSIQLALEQPADNSLFITLDLSKNYPWALELEEGEKCIAIDEGVIFDNMPVHYQCDNKTQLFGPLQRCKRPWTILQQNKGLVKTVSIKKAWF